MKNYEVKGLNLGKEIHMHQQYMQIGQIAIPFNSIFELSGVRY